MQNYKDKNIVIIGIGKTGMSCIKFFLRKNIIPKVLDEKTYINKELKKIPKNIEYYLGEINKKWILEANIIVVSPGINLKNPIFKLATKLGIEIIGDIELFCRETKLSIIAITGSNGKSTVSTMLLNMLKKSKYRVTIGGNIGFPVLNIIEDNFDILILEISSFQLESTKKLKTKISIIINLSRDHMDRYNKNMQEYSSIKNKIYNNAEICLFNLEDKLTYPNKNIKSKKISFNSKNADYCLKKHKNKLWIYNKNIKLFNISKMKLKNLHNHINAMIAIAIVNILNIPIKKVEKELINFKGLKHRFELIYSKDGIKWINDSKSTNIGSTKSAIKNLNTKSNIRILLGGDGKNTNFLELKKYLEPNYITIYCFGKDKNKIANILPKKTKKYKNLKEAMRDIFIQVKSGDTVLLSPACASTDQFLNFKHRGNMFIKLVKNFYAKKNEII
ncbi:UDP-N-acetylmuramoyl-L-alanine--D-glutamate ligase [Buchnera aphidicola (Neophyllaphis podocarpi)]|uniref:UDP-N-acetylmuramoyl-L-alanine--D-glutamate ligase n=1 Tax=Buchnera aphidicola TaxID=9 RepID=UPI0031B85A3A